MNSRHFLRVWLTLAILVAGGPGWLAAQQAVRKIQPNDLLTIRVLNEPEMAKESKVSSDGKIDYLYVGDVSVAGKTLAEAQLMIRELLMKDWFVNPQVIIETKQYALEMVTVMGQVGRPGPVQLPTDRRVDLVEVIGMAGDFTRLANKNKIELRRKGKRVQYSYDDLRKITDQEKKVFVEPDDVIDVAASII